MSSDPILRNNVNVLGNKDSAHSIVFVHGFGTEQSVWQALIEPLAPLFKIVLLDNAGAGKSDPSAFVQHRYLNLTRYADDLVEVCKALHLRNAIFVGHSVGAMITVLAANKSPDLVSRLVLIGASPRYLNAEGYVGGFEKADVNAIYESINLNFPAWAREFGETMIGKMASSQVSHTFIESIRALPADRALTVLCAILQSDNRDAVTKVTKPTLIIQSRVDMAVPQDVADYLHANIRGSELTVIDTEGHLPHLTAPDLLLSAMLPFISAGVSQSDLQIPAGGHHESIACPAP